MKRIFLILSPALTALSGCDPTTLFVEDPVATLETNSAEAVVGSDGTLATPFDVILSGSEVVLGDGYGFAVVSDPDSPRIEALAGVANTTSLGSQPTMGTATMTGDYIVGQMDNIRLDDDDRPIGSTTTEPGTITLTADFVGMTLTGTDNDLTVSGEMDNGVLSGTVNYDGLDGTLMGEIGPASAAGAFYGNDANTVFAGGFLVEE